MAPATEYFLFARQAEHHNRYEGAIISGLASVVTREENRLPHPTPEPDDYKEKADLPRVGDSIGASLGIAGLIALASAAILRKKNKKE